MRDKIFMHLENDFRIDEQREFGTRFVKDDTMMRKI